jgi:hypothetical protein
VVESALVFYSRLLSTVASASLFFLMLSRARDKTKKFFAVGIMFVSLWNLLELMMVILPSTMVFEATLLLISVLLCVICASIAISLFSVSLAYGKTSDMSVLISIVPLLAIPLIILFTPGVTYTADGWSSVYDPGFIFLFGGLSAVPVVYATYNLLSLFRKLSGKLKKQMVLFMAGMLVMLMSAEIVDVFLHTLYGTPALGSVGVFVGALIMMIPFIEQ